MSVCTQNNLHDAIIYIYNNGMLDFLTPFEELVTELDQLMNENDPNKLDYQVKLGNKILVYISQCLAGRAYPHGEIAKDQRKQVKYDAYTILTTLHSKKLSQENEPSYPYLRTLLKFDTQGVLNVISMAFEEPEFNSEMGRCNKQRLVDILLKVSKLLESL